ncbi:endonuclease/exonuclease/phosphatase family protein [Vibrio quintilis]|uniref:Endonuclease/Exonuclease/phosphatase family protein n=1 Tax=Vibrio quintilis TaxID=1117707 RepID=A0A1M7Z2Y6_9VIBR|nr:endonuclease/exonuclease/phosphatase family protein [Vibrio quintilis]SHO59016.1 Endonuclease/Exonuclease/phosphatase family protein [Vibrio quintilis]
MKKSWLGLLLLVLPVTFWRWSYSESGIWWAENWSSVPGLMVFVYLICSGFFFFSRRWIPGGLSVLLCILFVVRGLPDSQGKQAECGETVRILQYNMMFENEMVDSFIEFVRASLPDLMVLQEVTPQHGTLLRSLSDLYPYRYGGQPKIGYPSNQLILSRQVLYGMSVYRTNDDQKLIRGFWQPAPGVDIALFTAHPPSPRDQQLWHRRNLMFQTLSYLTGFVPVDNSLVIGDFNLSSDTQRYQQLFPEFSSLPVNSWPSVSPFPAIGIDHLWVRGAARICRRTAVTEVQGSDHWPVMTELSL